MNISLPAPFIFEQEDQNPITISLNIKQLTGYSFLNFYKNVFEDKVIEGIKTGEIKINQGNQNNPNAFVLDPAVLSNLAATNPALFQQIQQLSMQAQVNPASAPEINNQIQQLLMQASMNAQVNQPTSATIPNPASPAQPNNNPNTQNIQVPLKANAEQPANVAGGSAPSDSNVIDYVTIATTGNATSFGNLSVARSTYASGTASPLRAVFPGGFTPSMTATIDYVTISTLGNGVNFGSMTVARYGHTSCSNGHGGLV